MPWYMESTSSATIFQGEIAQETSVPSREGLILYPHKLRKLRTAQPATTKLFQQLLAPLHWRPHAPLHILLQQLWLPIHRSQSISAMSPLMNSDQRVLGGSLTPKAWAKDQKKRALLQAAS
jgi:hypothetical protein